MKISTDTQSSPIQQIKPAKANKKEDAQPPKEQLAVISTTANHQRMKSLFARVGIRQNMPLHDAKSRRNALDRRKEMLALQKVNNLQAVLEVALNVTLPEGNQEQVDPDWFFAFSQLAENIHSPAMQELWGKIFAVEVNKPGSFSLRSLETLKVLTQRDAKIFSRAAALASRRSGDTTPRIIVGYHQRKGLMSLFRPGPPEHLNLSAYGLSYPDLLALTDMKLIFASEIESGELAPGTKVQWRCTNETFSLTANKPGVALVYYKFTAVGAELFKLINRHDNQHYLAAIKHLLTAAFTVD
ncbi:TIGR03899 family protein [Alteromonas pelagimontana]|uniref:TIGR03899 family protein n=1 Tax=Alteromonas pelagimontana TaxID=1858656 RepID=A0A6M4MFF6_9ALTE|nr:TIGR03899 family protein [Alteromonas pelagimontana]QJR81618.1 TIGR03899 family protein [Alteromonas pelagimontana]